MAEYCVETDIKDSRCITTSRTVHCHINNGLMDIGFSCVVVKVELKGFQAELTAIELSACSGVTITNNTLILVRRGKSQQSLSFFIQKTNNIATII